MHSRSASQEEREAEREESTISGIILNEKKNIWIENQAISEKKYLWKTLGTTSEEVRWINSVQY